MTGPLRLLAQDADDLAPLSALVQDAIVQTGDIAFDRRGRRLVLMFSRYRWEARDRTRVRAALRIESVEAVHSLAWPADVATPIELLALSYGDGALQLAFAGGATLRAAVECVDIVLEDISSPWPARRTPRHE